MSNKRCSYTKNLNLRDAIEQRLAAAAEDIFRLLQERGPAVLEELKELVAERISAAVEDIFAAFRATGAGLREPEEPTESPKPGAGKTA